MAMQIRAKPGTCSVSTEPRQTAECQAPVGLLQSGSETFNMVRANKIISI